MNDLFEWFMLAFSIINAIAEFISWQKSRSDVGYCLG